MPSFHEVRHYLGGIWLLVKGDARGLSTLDISDRGVLRSFWAFAWCLPAYIVLWFDMRREHLAAFPDTQETTTTFFAKSALVAVADWLLPVVAIFAALTLLKQRALFRSLVVIWNWGSVAVVNSGILVLLTVIFAPEPADDRLWMVSTYGLYALIAAYFGFLLVSIWRILRTVVGGGVFQRLTILVIISLSLMLLEPLEKQLGIYVP